jgi:hypothetical protein
MVIKRRLLMIRYILSFICLFLAVMAFSQKSDTLKLPKNSLSLELGGNACGFGSINYERLFQVSNKVYISARVGVGYFYFVSTSCVSVPIMCNVIYHVAHVLSLEAGFGTTLYFMRELEPPEEKGFDPLITGLLGLRLQHPGNGFCFRAGFTPIIDTKSTEPNVFTQTFTPFAGFSFGYSF